MLDDSRYDLTIELFALYSILQSRLKPGRMLLVDTHEKRIIEDVELKLQIARSRPHSKWLKDQVFFLFCSVSSLIVVIVDHPFKVFEI